MITKLPLERAVLNFPCATQCERPVVFPVFAHNSTVLWCSHTDWSFRDAIPCIAFSYRWYKQSLCLIHVFQLHFSYTLAVVRNFFLEVFLLFLLITFFLLSVYWTFCFLSTQHVFTQHTKSLLLAFLRVMCIWFLFYMFSLFSHCPLVILTSHIVLILRRLILKFGGKHWSFSLYWN